jgi:hypothetical protein
MHTRNVVECLSARATALLKNPQSHEEAFEKHLAVLSRTTSPRPPGSRIYHGKHNAATATPCYINAGSSSMSSLTRRHGKFNRPREGIKVR